MKLIFYVDDRLIISRIRDKISKRKWNLKDNPYRKELENFARFIGEADYPWVVKEYEPVGRRARKHSMEIQEEWELYYPSASVMMKDITRMGFSGGDIKVYVLHPGLREGGVMPNSGSLFYGGDKKWEYYYTSVLWHLFLHKTFGIREDLSTEHAAIDLAAFEELRTRLQKNDYPPFAGHDYLKEVKESMLDDWNRHLNMKADIRDFMMKARAIA